MKQLKPNLRRPQPASLSASPASSHTPLPGNQFKESGGATLHRSPAWIQFWLILVCIMGILLFYPNRADAQGTAFTYQGRLNDHGTPVTGIYDLQFEIYDAASGGNQVGESLALSSLGITNGLFTVSLDFGTGVFDGDNRWLEIGARRHGVGSFEVLNSRQAITSSPYAIAASTLTGILPASQIGGALSPAQIPNLDASKITTGVLAGDGSNLTNLNAGNLTGILADSKLSTNVVRLSGSLSIQTNTYSSAGTYTVVVPSGAANLTVKLWGAGGAGGASGASGGGGAFVRKTIPVTPGESYIIVVGQRGFPSVATGGGDGSNDGEGGDPGFLGDYNGRGQGGQASSLFILTGGLYISKAVAGAGGGAGRGGSGGAAGSSGSTYSFGSTVGGMAGNNGLGGNGGGAGSVGANYSAAATTVGVSSLNLIGGRGGNGANWSGGGGGGYGGGGGGDGSSGDGGGGGGGGSFGDFIVGGAGSQPGNAADADYTAPNGSAGADGLAKIIFTTPVATVAGAILANSISGNGSGLTNLSAASVAGVFTTSQIPNLDASKISSGTFSPGRLGPNIAFLDGTNAFTGSNSFGGVTIATNANNQIAGIVSGNGSGLTNISPTGVTGAFSPQQIPNLDASKITSGIFTGNGSGLTNVPGIFPWQTVAGVAQNAAANTSYLLTNNSRTTLTLPSPATVGDVVTVSGSGTGGWQVMTNQIAGDLWTPHQPYNYDPMFVTAPSWQGVASSSDGLKLVAVHRGGYIYTSTDSGATWTARDSQRNWYSVASSADGTKLVAGESTGQIYTSNDSGQHWTPQNSPSGNWYSVASSSDGVKLVAVAHPGQIFTSSDAGLTWTPRASSRSYYSVASSADGAKLVAVAFNNQIYTSVDSGTNWTSRFSDHGWVAVASSADGTKLVAAASSEQIFTSTDSGASWTPRETNRHWQALASSSDGTTLVAAEAGGRIYISNDSGVTWAAKESARAWLSLASSSDTTTLVAGVASDQVYISLRTAFLSGTSGTTVSFQYSGNNQWQALAQKQIAAGSVGNTEVSALDASKITTGLFSGNGGGLTNLNATVLTGTIADARLGANVAWRNGTNSFTGTNIFMGVVIATNVNNQFAGTFSGNGSGLSNLAPASVAGTFDPVQIPNLDASKVASGTLSLSRLPVEVITNNTSGVTLNGTFRGAGAMSWQVVSGASQQGQVNNGYLTTNSALVTVILPATPSIGEVMRVSGFGAAGWKIAQNSGQSVLSGTLSSTVPPVFTARDSNRSWSSLASSSDGTKLVAGANNGFIYISSDSGATWTPRLADANRNWFSVASSSDGTKLVAVVWDGQIYTSQDSGLNWALQNASPNRHWYSVSCSSDGTKIVAVVESGFIYTSTDSGTNWTQRATSQVWISSASSADGTKLAAGIDNGQIYTSTDSGVNWTARASTGNWLSIASSSDGAKLAAVSYAGGQIYTSTDSGANWTLQTASPAANWYSIASSADGIRLAAVAFNGKIYTSTNSGVTWIPRENNRNWTAIASSTDGAKLVAGVRSGQIYTSLPTTAATTALGTAGYLQGSQNAAVELQYTGNGQFLPLSSAGSIEAY